MKKIIFVLVLCLLLSGCMSWMDGAAYSIERHQDQPQKPGESIIPVSNYNELLEVVRGMVEQGTQNALLSVEDYSANALRSGLDRVVAYVRRTNPIAAYAVTDIRYELGTTSGISAVAITVTYSRSQEEIQAIRTVHNMEQAKSLLHEALGNCDSSLAIRIEWFENRDFSQIVEDFAEQNPFVVMEIPTVTVTTYPDKGLERVVDLRFSYQTNRESLRNMQKYVQPIFASAALYVGSEEESDGLKYGRLYAFLMERSDYKLETSITPAYSLLRHGVGDSRAFATVYSAMCRRAGLECMVVSGTCQGEARFWNIICEDGVHYHGDLLSGNGFSRRTDEEMTGYVWDYSAYPACGEPQPPQESTAVN